MFLTTISLFLIKERDIIVRMDLSQAIANINMALHNNLAICTIKKTKQTKGLLKILHELGLVRSIQSKGLHWVVTLKSVFLGTNSTSKWVIKSLTTASKTHFVSTYQMQSVT